MKRCTAGILALVTLVVVGLITACTTAAGAPDAAGTPQRIAAISPDAAETIAALGAGDRLVMVPDTQSRATLTNHPAVMAAVETTIAAHGAADPEHILSASPDLVIVTPRHDGESDTAALLEGSSVDVLTLLNTWQTVEEMLANVVTIGDAIGESDSAEQLRTAISQEIAEVEPVGGPSPSVLVLSNQAGRPMVNTGEGFVLDLLARAGGADAARTIGLSRTGFADPEQVVQMDPDAILLVDLLGAGPESFAAVLDSPGVDQLPAVRQDRILLVEDKQVNALGLESVPPVCCRSVIGLLRWPWPDTPG